MNKEISDSVNAPLISLVIPVYNEDEVIAGTLEITKDIMRKLPIQYEIIIVDDGSTDNTWSRLNTILDTYPNLKLIRFTKNFGKEAAILAGLKVARGNAAIVMDGDNQHPPNLITDIVTLWRNSDYKVIHAQKIKRQKESMIHRMFVRIFYRIMYFFSGYDLNDSSDYKLIDRVVIDLYIELPEKLRFFRGLILWFGFKSGIVYYKPVERDEGKSKWTSLSLLKFGITAICAFSSLPLQLITIMGAVMLGASIILGLHTLYMKWSSQAVEGFTTVIILLLFIGSMLMISLGIIGQYLSMIYYEIKKRPDFVIEKYKNLSDNKLFFK